MKVHVKDITKETLEKIKTQLEQGKDFNLICGDMRIPEIERDALMDRLVKEVGYQIKDWYPHADQKTRQIIQEDDKQRRTRPH